MSADAGLPLPPLELATRTGAIRDQAAFWAEWSSIGQQQRRFIQSSLPEDWAWDGKRALDFGCGSGRTLRAFADRAHATEFWGCDMHEESIAWLDGHLSPPFSFFTVGSEPKVPQPDGFFDLVWAFSVFTHIVDDWSGWLLEIHRTLKPGGLALISYLGEGMIGPSLGETWDADRIGMNSLRAAQSWDVGGPVVFHSEWWLREHWGRAFEVIQLRGQESPSAHGLALLRKRDVAVTRAELEALATGEPREVISLQHNIQQLHDEEGRLRARLAAADAERAVARAALASREDELGRARAALDAVPALRVRMAEAEAEAGRLQEELARLQNSRSWRATQPLRLAYRRLVLR